MSVKTGRRVIVLPDLNAVGREAGEVFWEASKSSTASHGRFAVALSGGTTPRGLYALLGSGQYKDEINWRHAHFFWADERCVPKEHEESNFKTAFDAFLSKVPVPDGNIYRVRGEEEPEKAAEDYEVDMRKFFGEAALPAFDLIILGVGEDGHTASLFPGSKALEEHTRLAAPVYKEKPGINRVTLTLPVLNNASRILFLAAGQSKAGVVYDILEEGNKKNYPAGLVHPFGGNVLWLLDKEAGRRLKAAGL